MAKSTAKTKKPVRYFQKPKIGALFSRFFLPVVIAYFIGFLVMGSLALESDIQKVATKHIPISPAPHSIQGPALRAGKDLQAVVWYYLTHQPEPCVAGRTVNDFQRQQCREFEARLEILGWLAVTPFFFSAIAFFILFDAVRVRFARGRKRFAEGQSVGRAIVTDPARSSPDILSWWMGVVPITVQGAEGRQLVVYLPPEMTLPDPGAQVTLFDWGKFNGKKRYFAVLYAPHMAVLQGT